MYPIRTFAATGMPYFVVFVIACTLLSKEEEN
jgi:hypothetical protein